MIVYQDRLLQASVVVENDAGLWMVPRATDGWQRRIRLTMTAQARAEQLKPASGTDAAALGIPPEIPANSEGENALRQVTKEATAV